VPRPKTDVDTAAAHLHVDSHELSLQCCVYSKTNDLTRAYLRGRQGAMPPVGRWLQIMVTMDANKCTKMSYFQE